MNIIKSMCVITPGYPSVGAPIYTFVQNLVEEWVDCGIDVIVISPQSVTKQIFRKTKKREKQEIRLTKNGNKYRVLSPNYISLSEKKCFGINSGILTNKLFVECVKRTYKKNLLNVDVIYAHFFKSSGLAGISLKENFGVPIFIGNGESSLECLNILDKEKLRKKIQKVDGIISVSTKNKRELIDYFNGDRIIASKIQIFPNGYNSKKFYKIDKSKARKILGFSKDIFIVVYTGSFIERKGPLRLAAALDKCENVYSVFIGSGIQEPKCKNILYKGVVENKDIKMFLSAADVFVLPTTNEGCCNAIVEAIACGLPIISSNKDFNDDIIDTNNSIRVNSTDVKEISDAIKFIKDNWQIRKRMQDASLEKAKKLTIEERCKNILRFINKRIG